MDNWRSLTIGDIADIYDGPHATPIKTEEGPYFLSISSLVDGKLDLSQSAHLSEQDFIEWTRRVTPQANDLVFSYETRLGQAALIPDGLRCCLGRRMGLLRFNTSIVEPRYISHAFLGPEFQETIRQNITYGSTVDRILLTELGAFPLLIPPLAEQRRIAEILGAWDEAIALTGRLIDALKRRKQGLMQRLLAGEVRFLEYADEEWINITVGDLIEKLSTGVSVNSEDRLKGEGELGILKTSAVTYGVFDPRQHKTVLRDEEQRVAVSPTSDTIILSRINTKELVGASAYVDRDYPDLYLPDRLWLIEADRERCYSHWLRHLFASKDFRSRVSNLASGTSGSMKNISQESFIGLEVPLPSLDEQYKIANVLDVADEFITFYMRSAGLLRIEKKGLMQRLLTGKIRVGVEG